MHAPSKVLKPVFLTSETELLVACLPPPLDGSKTHKPKVRDIEYSPRMCETLDSMAGIRGGRSEVQGHPGYVQIWGPPQLETLSKINRQIWMIHLHSLLCSSTLPRQQKSLDGWAHDLVSENACVPLTGWWGGSLPAQ